jgi:hypothetical protein
MNYETAALADILAKNQAFYVDDDDPVALAIRYIGDEESATVTVSGGDITFQHGDLASEAVDDTIDSGGDDAGVIDVSDAEANTMGEVVDLINASANWEAVLVDCLRADASTAAKFLDVGETTLTPTTELMIIHTDTSGTLEISKACGYTGLAVELYEADAAKAFLGDADYYVRLNSIIAKNTYGSGTSHISVYDIDPVTNTETLVFKVPAAATTVEKTINFLSDMGGLDVIAKGHYFLCRLEGSEACTGYLNVAWTLKEY